jgi:hypothetical protein
VTLAFREQCIHWAIFSTTLFSIPKTKIVENSKKSPKGIDKIKIRFIIIKLWGKVGKKGKMEHIMTEGVESELLSGVYGSYGHSLNILRVLLFCMKYPKLKFTAECVAVNQGVDRVALEKEIQDLISHGILGEKSDAGITYYCLNRTQQELTELTEEFLRDWHLHEIGVRAERA